MNNVSKMTKRFSTFTLLASLGFAACASAPSHELLDARKAYARASTGPAATAVPADVRKARVSLDLAENAFSNDTSDQRDLAYVATRKAQLAEVLANRAAHASERASAEAALAGAKDADHKQTKEELERTKSNLATSEQDAAVQKQKAADAEKRAADADRKVKAMQLELAKWAAVKEEPRGVVITLSGSVLFASDKSALLPDARTRLKQVTLALMETKERHLDVEGYTDSQGKDAYNLDLSQKRADAVRTFLIGEGYPPDLIVAHGVGKAMPIADNNSAEGRANNRRVEIIIMPASTTVSTQ